MDRDKRPMWHFPWMYRESIAVVAGIAAVGFMLQLTLGRFDFFLLASPVNKILGALIVLFVILLSLLRQSEFFRWLSGVPFCVALIGTFIVLGVVMGLTIQAEQLAPHDHTPVARMGFRQMTSSWPFVLIYFVLLISLGALIVRRLTTFALSWRNAAFYLNHIGLWIVLLAGGLGAADMKRYVMHVREGEVEWRVYSEQGDVLELPIAIQLNDFDMEEYAPKLTVIDRESGAPQPEHKPDYYQIEKTRTTAMLADWNMTLEEFLPRAIRDSDSTYRAIDMPGSSPAARVSLVNRLTGERRSGWVCCGNVAQLYMTLPLDSSYMLVMTRPEPKRFMSDITVFTEDGADKHAVLEVNKPLKMGDWMLYQYSYDDLAGRMSTYTSIELVYDPWLKIVYAGIILLAAGSVCMLWSGNFNSTGKRDDLG